MARGQRAYIDAMLFADAFAVVGLYLMVQTVGFVLALVCMALGWFWNRVLCGRKPVEVLRYQPVVKDQRTPLTPDERQRRLLAFRAAAVR